MGVKAPAPPRSGNITPALIGVGLVLVLLGAVGWFTGRQDADQKPTPSEEERNVLITFEGAWGLMVPTGEEYEDTGKPIIEFHSDDRPLDIKYYINGEEFEGDQYESDSQDSGIWRIHETVPIGSTVTLRISQEDTGWLMCNIKQDEITVAMSILPEAGTCEVEHVVFGVA